MEVLKNAVVCDQLADRVICNICGHEIPKDRFGYFQDYVHIDKTWDIILIKMEKMFV